MENKSVSKSFDITVILADQRLGYEEMYAPEDILSFDILKDALEKLKEYNFTYLDNHCDLIQTLAITPPKFVLNMCDDGFKNKLESEPYIPALLEMLDIPYTGAGPGCLSLCYNKQFVSSIASSIGLPVPEEFLIELDDVCLDDNSALKMIPYPSLIKPTCGDGSMGITEKSLVYSAAEAKDCINEIVNSLPDCKSILIQEFLPGNEYHIGIIGNIETGYEVLPILEVDYCSLPDNLPKLLTSDSKWSPDSVYCKQIEYKVGQPDNNTREKLINYSTKLFKNFGCRDYARFDFRLDKSGVPKIMDVNPNPSWAHDGKLNFMAQWAGYSYSDLLDMIIKAARRRVNI